MKAPTRYQLFASIPILLTLFTSLILLTARPPHTLKPRVFVIGLSKTGTTSIGDALELLGYRRLGWRDIRSRHMVHTWAHGDLQPLLALTQRYDALEDLPWPFVYREMAARYPDARFILSLRKDDETWVRSMRRHVGRGRWQPYNYFYGADTFDSPGNEDIIRASYVNHTARVREFFATAGPHRYMEMNIDDGDLNWPALCNLTEQCPPGRFPAVGFPRANTAAHWDMPAVVASAQWWWGWTVTRLEELSARRYYEDVSAGEGVRLVLNVLWAVYNVVEQAYSELCILIAPLVYPPIATIAERDARLAELL